VQAVRQGVQDVVQMEYRARRPDGAWGWQSHWRLITERDPVTNRPIRALGVIMDTTQRALAEAELRATLGQRDLLLREVYHRVKNNLQIVDGIVMMQARTLKDDDARQALKALRSRIYALGLVHHQLMTSKDLETFDLQPFLEELTRNILDGGGARQVDLELQIEPMRTGLDFAIPLGLLVTELVTNALKHAFSDGVGRIRIVLKRRPDGRFDLTVADNGTGRPEVGGVQGLGSVIIAGLVSQLDGEITTRNDDGLVTEIILSTPERT
jgi:two-component sensor histidine kinase